MQQAIIKFLMKLRESKPTLNFEESECSAVPFNHPHYLSLDETAQTEFGLRWARKVYQAETERPGIDVYLGDIDLSECFKDKIMLDIGCSVGGKTVRYLEKYKGAEIYGIDIDPRFVQFAKGFAEEKGANAHFKVNFAEDLDFPDAFFDVIFSINTFEHVRDIHKVMQECRRVLKDKGFMVVIFPSFWCPLEHHLSVVTRTPCIHWFFKFPDLLEAYFSILDERGEDALWYRRKDEHPLPFEKGNHINGTGAMQFRKMVRGNWDIIADGFKQRYRSQGFVKNTLMNSIKMFPFLREIYPITYVLQKR